MRYVIVMILAALLLAACGPAAPATTDEDGSENAGTGGSETTASGLQYIEVEAGGGERAMAGDTVQVHYTGMLADGTVFDSSEGRDPFTFVLGQGSVIRGWDEGIALMNEGGKAQLIIPSELAYGPQGRAPTIPPDAELTFDVELVGIVAAPTPVPPPTPAPTPTSSPDETVTDSGLRIITLEEGNGATPVAGDLVQMHFVAMLADNSVFDNSYENGEPLVFTVGEGPIAGWDEGVQLMAEGGKARLIVSPELGLGEQGAGAIIPPNATLILDVELLAILEGAPEAPTEVDDVDYVTTDSGLKYYDFVVGDGGSPAVGEQVLVHYTGWLEDGTKFDSSVDRGRPFPLVLGTGAVIPGWDEGLLTMQYGGKRQLVIPPDLAYGEEGFPGAIPPNSTLIFEVELISPATP